MLSTAPSTSLCQRLFIRSISSTSKVLAGHNKWSKIKEGKGKNDGLKSKIYARANREIFIAVKNGGSGDQRVNAALANAIARAKADGVPKANIQAALDQAQSIKGSGTAMYEYEAILAGKLGFVIECLSDNNTRTVREIRNICKKHEVQMGSVSYMFDKKMQVQISLPVGKDFDTLWNDAVDRGAHDVNESHFDEDKKTKLVEVLCSREDGSRLVTELRGLGYDIVHSEIIYVPQDVGVDLDDGTKEAAQALIEELEDHPDVSQISTSPRL